MTKYKDKLNQAIGKANMLKTLLINKENKLKEWQSRLIYIEDAQIIIQQVAKETQEMLRYHIEDIVQLAIDTCFPGEYEFCVDFEIKRGRTEAKISFLKNDNKINPMNAAGGGVVDLASFALRIAAWSLGKTDNVIILDEPFRFLSKDLIEKASKIVKELSEKLNLQFIIVTHINELTEYADKVFEVKLKDNISRIN